MSLLQKIKDFFRSPKSDKQSDFISEAESQFNIKAHHIAAFEVQMGENQVGLREESQRLATNYGDFNSFLYQTDFDNFIRQESVIFGESGSVITDLNHWPVKHPFNFPGPFYTGESDTCGTGVYEAPQNVMNDSHCGEFVFKQPTNFVELLGVLNAAAVEAFDSYSSNGNEYWTYKACKEWWGSRQEIIAVLRDEELIKMNYGQAQLYIDYLNGDAEVDLRRYCYFLIHGSYPMDENAVLPSL